MLFICYLPNNTNIQQSLFELANINITKILGVILQKLPSYVKTFITNNLTSEPINSSMRRTPRKIMLTIKDLGVEKTLHPLNILGINEFYWARFLQSGWNPNEVCFGVEPNIVF